MRVLIPEYNGDDGVEDCEHEHVGDSGVRNGIVKYQASEIPGPATVLCNYPKNGLM